jgi:two-component system, OmpR family, sensor histidine kinase BaeS
MIHNRTRPLRPEILADIAHEFQTPLAILRGNVEILAAAATKTEKLRAATTAKTTIDRLSRLIANLLKATYIEPVYEAVDMTLLLEETYYDCAILAEDAGISLSLWIAEDAAKTFLRGDRDKLKEVLLNLLSNALKNTPSGGAISLAMKFAGSATIEIMVADTGSGIATENLPHIFERLYTISPDGHGIGLYLCQKIITAHHGTIAVESELGKGSRFTISLPLAPPTQPASSPVELQPGEYSDAPATL